MPQRLDRIVEAVLAGVPGPRAGRPGSPSTPQLAPRVVVGERVLLERLVANLVENGIKYNRRGGSLTVAVGGRPALAVVNTGQPVPAEAVAGLFEPFRRLARDRTRRAEAPVWGWPSPARSPRRTTASSRPGPPSKAVCGSTSNYPM